MVIKPRMVIGKELKGKGLPNIQESKKLQQNMNFKQDTVTLSKSRERITNERRKCVPGGTNVTRKWFNEVSILLN